MSDDLPRGAVTVVCRPYIPDNHWPFQSDDERRDRGLYVADTEQNRESEASNDPVAWLQIADELIEVGRYVQHETVLDVLDLSVKLNQETVHVTIARGSDEGFQHGEHSDATDGTPFDGFAFGSPSHWKDIYPQNHVLTSARNPLNGTVEWHEPGEVELETPEQADLTRWSA